jgi:purine-nucleoside phosphorylase
MDQLNLGIRVIRDRTDIQPEFGLVLGSGLGYIADLVEEPVALGYTELPGFPLSTVEGHAGRLVLGTLAGRKVAVMQGRVHYYEGYSMDRIVMGVRLMASLGAERLLITNAAGGIRDDLTPGDLMLITDHINLMGQNPLMGRNPESLGPRFPDMSDAYSAAMRKQAHSIAAGIGMALKEGVYAAFTGPSYETPAEIRMLKIVGAHAVGMSTIPEVIAACHMGVRVLAISCISNLAAGISSTPLTHDEVKETAERNKEKFSKLLLSLVAGIDLDGRAAR